MRPFESFLAPESLKNISNIGYPLVIMVVTRDHFFDHLTAYLKENEYCWDSLEPKLFLELRKN